jgi:hypothetical protein
MKEELPPIDAADEEELRSAAALARALDGGPAEADLPQAALETAALLRLSAGTAQLGNERRAQIRRELLEGLVRPEKAAGQNGARAKRGRGVFALPRWLLVGFPLAGAAALSLLLLVRGPEPAATLEPVASSARDDGALRAADEAKPGAAVESPRGVSVPLTPGALALKATDDGAPLASHGKESSAVVRVTPLLQPEGTSAAPAGEVLGARGRSAAAVSTAAAAPAGNLALRAKDDGARRALVGLGKEVDERRVELLARVNDAELSGAHAELDAAKNREELERSQRALSRALDTLGDEPDPTDARLVRQDLYCRLAETALRIGEPRAALEWTRRGLDLDGPPTPFLAQLMALEGDAWAALGDDASAAASYMKALRVHETLLDESLDGR